MSGILRTAYIKFYCKSMVPMENVPSEGYLLAVSTHQMSRTPNGKPKTQNKFWVPETHFIHPMSNVESFAEFIGKIIFQI